MTYKALILAIVVILGYVSSTWFVFGAVHPCEILVVRQKDHHLELAERHYRTDLESLKEVARKSFHPKEYDQFARNLEEYSNVSLREENQNRSVLTALRQAVREMTPAQCAWQALIWRPRPAD